MWTFERPALLVLSALIPPMIFIAHLWKGRGGMIAVALSNWRGVGFRAPLTLSRVLYWVATGAFWLGLSLLTISTAGPTFTSQTRVFLNRGMDIMFVLDESPSMAAQDVPPLTRFQIAKDTIRAFVEQRPNDAFGLVSYAGEAALRVPPTLDHPFLLDRLGELELMDLGEQTAIGVGIAVAALHLNIEESDARAMIVLTDGDNNAGEILPLPAAAIAAEMGIRIYTIGVGSNREVPIEYTDARTGELYRGTYIGEFNTKVLEAIAVTTNGLSFTADDRAGLAAVFAAIDSIEIHQNRVRIVVETDSRTRLFVMVAFALLLFDYLVRKALLKEVL